MRAVFFLILFVFVHANVEAEDLSFSDTDRIKIIEKPIYYSKKRELLSLQYLKDRYNIIQSRPTIKPIMIVLHYTDGGTVNSIYDYFNKDEIEEARKFNKKESKLNVSSHYLVDRDGTIYHLIADSLFARHVIGLNYCSIGIENIGNEKEPLTNKQIISNTQLIKYLAKKYPIKYLIGHSEYSQFRNTRLWKEKDPKYFTYKSDPGKAFLFSVRKSLTDLKFLYKPE